MNSENFDSTPVTTELAPAHDAPGGPIMLETDEVDRVLALAAQGKGSKAIAKALCISRNTVKRYLAGARPGHQVRPTARRWDEPLRQQARALYLGPAAGNVAVVAQELANAGIPVPLRTLQAILAPLRRDRRARELATVRFETEPGEQMQIDFGQKRVTIAERPVVVHLMAVVLCYSRRLHVRPGLAQRQDDWLEGLQEALECFGGMPRQVLCDNASPLVNDHDRSTGTVAWHPGFVCFCRDRGLAMRACVPGRARTKGKIERVVGYIKHNALAGRTFADFDSLRRHLSWWTTCVADQRIHGTTHEKPAVLFERHERAALRPLPVRPLPVRTRRLVRTVSADGFVDVDTVRYSVPFRYVRDRVDVAVGATHVEILRRGEVVATHARSERPHEVIRDPRHLEGLYRPRDSAPPPAAMPPLRPLSVYERVVEGGQS